MVTRAIKAVARKFEGNTMRFTFGIFFLLVVATSGGCRMIRGVEQWKCDNLGMCYFGTSPSGGPQAYAPQQTPPMNSTNCRQCQK